MSAYRTFDADVRDGQQRVGLWESADVAAGGRPVVTVLAIHGITASHVSWAPVADRLTAAPGVRVIAPDLRGRGRSATLQGPWGMATHADDAAAVLDALQAESAVVIGHSMGGFVAVALAAQHPAAVAALLLVDGGVPLPIAPEFAGIDPEEAVRAALGPAAQRLSMTFESVGTYRDFWRAHPAFVSNWSEAIEHYVDYDLTGEPPRLRSSVNYDALMADSLEIARPELPGNPWRKLKTGVLFLRAPLGLLAEPPGLYPPPHLEAWAAGQPGFRWEEVPDVNHYTITLGPSGADAVAAAALSLSGTAPDVLSAG